MTSSGESELHLRAYQDFVRTSRYDSNAQKGWEIRYSDLLMAEGVEFLDQHGPGMLPLLPRQQGWSAVDTPVSMRYKMADEMGDLLWFTTDIADRRRGDIRHICWQSVLDHGITETDNIETFHDLSRVAVANDTNITVPNKAGMLFENLDRSLTNTSLDVNPLYVFMRATHRLARALDKGTRDLAPPTATEIEPAQDIEAAIGTLLLSMAYISTERLGVSINDIARFNMAKLTHREAYGKQNDIQLDADFLGIDK